jgi:hypothetical protein
MERKFQKSLIIAGATWNRGRRHRVRRAGRGLDAYGGRDKGRKDAVGGRYIGRKDAVGGRGRDRAI